MIAKALLYDRLRWVRLDSGYDVVTGTVLDDSGTPRVPAGDWTARFLTGISSAHVRFLRVPEDDQAQALRLVCEVTSEAGVVACANRLGALVGMPDDVLPTGATTGVEGESVDIWMHEARGLRLALAMLRGVQSLRAANTPRARKVALAECQRWAWRPDSGPAPPIDGVLSSLPSTSGTTTDASRSRSPELWHVPSPVLRMLGEVTEGWRPVYADTGFFKDPRPLSAEASLPHVLRQAVALAVRRRVKTASFWLSVDEHAFTPRVTAPDLLSFLWLQVARAAASAVDFVACAGCPNTLERGTAANGRTRRALFCSDVCRARKQTRDNADCRRLAAEGISVEQIADLQSRSIAAVATAVEPGAIRRAKPTARAARRGQLVP